MFYMLTYQIHAEVGNNHKHVSADIILIMNTCNEILLQTYLELHNS